jgi:hypothetical protein
VDAGITGLRLNSGGLRVLTPNGDGYHDRLRIGWTNEVSFDSMEFRLFRLDGSLVGRNALGETSAGRQTYHWNGRIGGSRVPAGSYVVQLRGKRGSTTYTAPSAAPVSSDQVATFGVVVGSATPTELLSFRSSPGSPTRSGSLTYTLRFGGPVRWLLRGDLVRSGTATGCSVGAPSGKGAVWTVKVTGCRAGTVKLTLKARTVADAVRNWGPGASTSAPTVVIDRSKPSTSRPRAAIRAGAALGSPSTPAGVPVRVTWSGADRGGAGIRDYDVRRSVDGGPWQDAAVGSLDTEIWQTLAPGHTYRYKVRARDRAGNVGAWVAGPTIPVVLRQNESDAIRLRPSWKLGWTDGYSGGTVRFATAAGAAARYSFTGRSIAVVTTRRPDGGKVKVYLDGVYVKTIDTGGTATAFRQVAFSRTWSTPGSHTIRLVVVGGTAGHVRFDLDALAVLR